MLDRVFGVIQVIIAVVFFFSVANTLKHGPLGAREGVRHDEAIRQRRSLVFLTILLRWFSWVCWERPSGLAIGMRSRGIVSDAGDRVPPPPQGSSRTWR
jgi:hypothetical protein